MSDTETVRDLREKFTRQRQRQEWMMIIEGIAIAIVGPLTVAVFGRLVWGDAVSPNPVGLAIDGLGLGAMLVCTWRGVRFGRRLRAASAAFDDTLSELRQEATKAYAKGREDERAAAKAATIELLRHLGQSFANVTGAGFELMFEGEHIVCEPKAERIRPPEKRNLH